MLLFNSLKVIGITQGLIGTVIPFLMVDILVGLGLWRWSNAFSVGFLVRAVGSVCCFCSSR